MAWADTASELRAAGWAGTLPLPPGQKAPPPRGYTGTGDDPDDNQIEAWATANADANIGLRLPADVVGIDVDAYKPGADDVWCDLWDTRGDLPPTIRSTSRADGSSGIRLYRVNPAAWDTPGALPTTVWGPGIECIRRGHRYMVVAPSVHPEGGVYRWLDEATGEILAGPPPPHKLPALPAGWYGGWDTPADTPSPPIRLNPAPTGGLPLDETPVDWWTRTTPGTFLDDLEDSGWTVSHTLGDDLYMVRPGKSVRDGHSAVLHPTGVLMIFSDDPGLAALHRIGVSKPEGTALTRFHHHAATQHAGDMNAAARAIQAQRQPLELPRRIHPELDPEPKPPRFQLIRGAGIRDIPQPVPLIDGYLDTATLALLFGGYGTGKTFVALDWAMHVAAGRNWQGCDTVQGPVVVIAAEGSTGMGARFDAWCHTHRVPPDSMGDLWWLPAAPQLARAEDLDELAGVLIGVVPRLVVVDTFARTAVGVQENDAASMGEWVHGVDHLARTITEASGVAPCMLIVHHAGKESDRGARGSVALPAATSAVFKVAGDATFASLECERQKDRERSLRRTFWLEPAGTSVAPMWHDLAPTDGGRRSQDVAAGNVLRALVRVSDPAHGASTTVWSDAAMEQSSSGSRTMFYESRKWLVERGYVARIDDSRTSPNMVTAQGHDWLETLLSTGEMSK